MTRNEREGELGTAKRKCH